MRLKNQLIEIELSYFSLRCASLYTIVSDVWSCGMLMI